MSAEGERDRALAPCAEFEERIQLLAGNELPPGDAAQVSAHLDSCPRCAEFARALRSARSAVRRTLAGAVPGPAPERLLRQAMALSRARRMRRGLLVALSVASALAACVAAAVLGVFGRASPDATGLWRSGDVSVTDSAGKSKVASGGSAFDVVVSPGNTVRTGTLSSAALALGGGSRVVLDQRTAVTLVQPAERGLPPEWRLAAGKILVRHPRGAPEVVVATSDAVVTTRGTEFDVAALPGRTECTVYDGEVLLRAAAGARPERVVPTGSQGTVDSSGVLAVSRSASAPGDRAADAPPGGVFLRYRLVEGDSWRWAVEGSLAAERQPAEGLKALAAALFLGPREIRALAGEALCRVESASGRQALVGVTGAAGPRVEFEMDPLGARRLASSDGAEPARAFLRPERGLEVSAVRLAPWFPERPVALGETWEHVSRGVVLRDGRDSVELRIDAVERATLAGVAPETGLATIRREIPMLALELRDLRTGRAIAAVRSSGTGTALFDPLAGVLTASELEIRSVWTSGDAPGPGGRYTERLSLRLVR